MPLVEHIGRVEAHFQQGGLNALIAFSAGRLVVEQLQRFLQNAAVGIELVYGREGVLEDALDFTPIGFEVSALGQVRYIVAVQVNAPGRGVQQAQDQASERGFTAAAFADDGYDFPRLDMERHILHRVDRVLAVPKGAREVFRF